MPSPREPAGVQSAVRRRRSALAGVAIIMAVLASCSGAPNDGVDDGAEPTHPPVPEPTANVAAAQIIAEGLDAPWSIAFHQETALVSERDSARILEIGETGTAREIAKIEGVAARGEGGLLGIAVDDDHLYVYFTADDENRIERHVLSGTPGALALSDPETVLDGIPSSTNHNGGRIAFGPDGMLYATTGDAGDASSAQDLDSLAGKILRVTGDGEVPDDNPFAGSPVFSYGHRNPQGIAWAEDGTLYATEFGQDTWDELNVIEPGGNYGWPEVEGAADDRRFLDPVQQWTPGEASPSGMAIWQNSIHIANLRGERLRDVPLSALEESAERFVGEYGRLRDVVVAPDGALWILTNNTDGRGQRRPEDDRIVRLAPGS